MSTLTIESSIVDVLKDGWSLGTEDYTGDTPL